MVLHFANLEVGLRKPIAIETPISTLEDQGNVNASLCLRAVANIPHDAMVIQHCALV